MYEQERRRADHLVILLCGTIFSVVLTVESILLGWEMGAVALLLLGVAVCWGVCVLENVPESIRLWMYFVMTMLGFFFYGIHKSSFYDLAPVMILFILMFSITERPVLINLCVATYYLTMGYVFIYVLHGDVEWAALPVTRTLLHLTLVFFAGRLAKVVIKRHSEERKDTDSRIAALKEANRRAEDFLTNVSHELRTPINAVTGITAVMLKGEEDAGKKKDLMSIQLAGYRLFGQIEDILDYTEIDTGRVTVSEDAYIISSLVNDVIIGDRLMEKAGGLELIFDVDAAIPSVLLGDGRKIKKILRHLVDNAIKFTKKGAVYVRLYAIRKAYGINLCIQVSDTGIGIDEENLGQITEKFFQSNEGRSRSAGGLGLGLSIASGMAAAMEGFIQVESTPGSGTTVTASIPQKIVDDSPVMTVDDRASLCLGCYLKPGKYEGPEVRDYYNQMISHMVRGLDIPLHRAFDLDELKRLAGVYQLTHLFIGDSEYVDSPDYYEGLEAEIEVIVMADDRFMPPRGSRVKLVRKPFYGMAITNILNARAAADTSVKARMICPGVKVLVVDDEPMNLMVAEEIFRDYQMDVSTAGSGMEAINQCAQEDFDVIFLDHMMPEMDGVETLKQLRQIHTDTGRAQTVIAFTSNAVSGAREMFLREGFDEFVSKPIEELELERVLRKVLPKASIELVDEGDLRDRRADGQEDGADAGSEHGPKARVWDEWMARLEDAGIDTAAGMRYCRGDARFYEEVLARFAGDGERRAAEISTAFRGKDLEKYRILVHALKSSAKTVGAGALSELARRAEEAAKHQDREYIRAHQKELLAQYHELCLRLAQALELDGDAPAQAAPEKGAELSRDELLRRLAALKEKLDTFEAEPAAQIIAELEGAVWRGAPAEALLREVKLDVEEFECGAASEKVEALKSSIEIGET